MAVVISEIVTEVVVAGAPPPAPATGTLTEEAMDAVVRRAAERVVELLRREWDC